MKGREWFKNRLAALEKYKYVFLVVLVGVVLLLLPGEGERETAEKLEATDIFQMEQTERKLEKALSKIEGAGDVTVLLTLQGGPRRVLAQDGSAVEEGERISRETSTILLSKGSGQQEPAVLQELAPVYQGALVVCSGGDDPQVKLAIYQALSALTGLKGEQISICKGK